MKQNFRGSWHVRALLLLCLTFQIPWGGELSHAAQTAQQNTIRIGNVTNLKELIRQIEAQTSYKVSYQGNLADNITIKADPSKHNVEELLADDFEPACNLYIASGHNEEIFGDGIHEAVKYFEKQGIEFEFAIDEGGGVISAPIDGIDCKCAMIAVHEKGYHRINVRAVQGDSEGLTLSDNPVTRVSKFIAEVSALKLTIKMPAQVREMFTALLPYMNFPLRLIFANLWCFEPLLIKLMPKINSQAAAMLGTTCVFGSIESKKGKTPRDNACSASALIRYIDEEDLVGDMEKIRELAKKYALEITEPADGHEFHRPADTGSRAFKYVCRCARDVFPHAAVAPFVLAAGTDARWMSDVCPCTLRFAPIDINMQQFNSVHSVDENIDLSAIGAAIEFYKEVLRNYK